MVFKIIKIILKVLFHVRVTGNVNNFNDERLIITANHASLLNGILLALFLPVRPLFAIYAGYANHWLIRLAKHYIDFIPLDPANPMIIRQLVRLVANGRPVIIFPEGRVTISGALINIYDGTAFVAAKTTATVVPVWIEGADFTFMRRLKGILSRQLWPNITIHILQPQTITMPDAPKASVRRYLAGETLQQIMLEARVVSRPKLTLFEAFLESQVKNGAGTCIIQDPTSKHLSYHRLLQQILAVSCIIEKLTTNKERVGVLLPNAVACVATIFALSLKQRTPAMLNYTAGEHGLNCAVKAAQITTIITSKKFLNKAKLTHLLDQITGVTWCFLEEQKSTLTLRNKAWVLVHQFIPRLLKYHRHYHDEALLLFTSGSEGSPKGVVHSHASLLANVEQICAVIEPMTSDRFMSTLPLFHAFGFTAGLLLPLCSGSKTFLYPNPLHYKMVPEVIYDQNCTVLFGTPTFLANYARYAHPYNFMRLRYVVAGAEKLSENLREVWKSKFGIRILEGYGVTECAPVISLNVPMAYKAGTVGRALPGMVTRLIAVPGIAEGGRLQLQGPNIMNGYLLVDNPGHLVKPNATDSSGHIDKGWYDTGDIVAIDNDGFITIKGRLKRFAKIAGEMVSLETVEALAKALDSEAMHGATIKTDAAKGEAIVLFTTSPELTREKLNQVAQAQGIAAIALPRDIRIVEQLPLLGSGKIDYIALHNLAEQA